VRRLLWLLALSAVTSACSNTAPPFRPVADVKQLMATVVEPAAETYWDAVGTIIDQDGVTEIEPQTTEEWDAVRNSAVVVAESGNLLMMSTRARDGGEWMQLSRAMIEVGQKAIRAAEARDKAAVFDVGAEVYDVCTGCHAKYAVDLLRPNAQ
jgi:hypothetical protein